MIMNRRTFFVFVMVEPLRLGMTIQINTWNKNKTKQHTKHTKVPMYVTLKMKKNYYNLPEEEAKQQ